MSRASGHDRRVSATELAKMAACERQVVFDARFGHRLDTARRSGARAGNRDHERHHEAVLRYHRRPIEHAGRDPRCFIASAVFGPHAWQTERLRRFRDRRLRGPLGRLIVALYYRLSPSLARWLAQKPCLAAPVRGVLTWLCRWL